MRLGRNISLGAPKDMSSINNKKSKKRKLKFIKTYLEIHGIYLMINTKIFPKKNM